MIDLPKLKKPGLLITGTDTGVGKTVVTCAIAAALRASGQTVGPSKPFASGCRQDREGLVSEDTEALAHFADASLPLDQISPLRFADPLAPGPAAEKARQSIDWRELGRSLTRLDESSDTLLIEGVGGLLVPLDPEQPKVTVLDLAVALGYPVIVVARPNLGTLNHTAMTVELLRRERLDVAGIVINGFDPEATATDPSLNSNRAWLEKMTGKPILAITPKSLDDQTAPHLGRIDAGVLESIAAVDWSRVAKPPKR